MALKASSFICKFFVQKYIILFFHCFRFFEEELLLYTGQCLIVVY